MSEPFITICIINVFVYGSTPFVAKSAPIGIDFRQSHPKLHPLSQTYKGAVVVTLCQNEADVKFQMDIDSHISITEQAGKIGLTSI